jgi:hypothetical protein
MCIGQQLPQKGTFQEEEKTEGQRKTNQRNRKDGIFALSPPKLFVGG